MEIEEYLTMYRNGKLSGCILTDQGFFHIRDAYISYGELVIEQMYEATVEELELV